MEKAITESISKRKNRRNNRDSSRLKKKGKLKRINGSISTQRRLKKQEYGIKVYLLPPTTYQAE